MAWAFHYPVNSYGLPHPIPLYQTAQAHRPAGQAGNTPFPLGLLQMPVQYISWLLYRAATFYEIVEWTPLSEGPGARVDYTGAVGWDGIKFTAQTIPIFLPDPFPAQNSSWGSQYPTPQAARDGVRGYDVFTAENPNSESWSFLLKPGQWIDAGPWAPLTGRTDGTMRYDIATNWPGMQQVFTATINTELAAWISRLDAWLAAEQAKEPPNQALIADIQRQQNVAQALSPQIVSAGEIMMTLISDSEDPDQLKTNAALQEIDSFLRWIAAEEILEAFSATEMPLNLFRRDFVQHVKFMLSRQWFGWDRNFLNSDSRCLFLGAGLTTAALQPISTGEIGALTTKSIPALQTGQIAVNFSQPFANISLDPPYGFNASFATIFTQQITVIQTNDVPGLSSDQLPNLSSEDIGNFETNPITELTYTQITAIGPVAIGFSAEACNAPQGATIPIYGNGVQTQPLNTQSFPVLAGEQVGLFRIEDGTAIGTQPVPGIKIYECPLFANAERVGALNITWRILTTRP